MVPVRVKGDELHRIDNVWSDIEDLDVGDLDDMMADVPLDFALEVQRTSRRLAVPQLKDLKEIGPFADVASEPQHLSFVAFKQELSEELGKRGTEDRAAIWKTLLETGGVKAQLHVTDPGKILFVTRRVEMLEKIKEFALSQPETDWFEFKQQKYYAQGRSEPAMSHEERKQREIELGWREKPLPRVEKAVDLEPRKRRRGRKGSKSGGGP